MKFDEPEVVEQPCGCKTITTDRKGQEPDVRYVPCLPCALTNAGLMLQAAGARMQEAIDAEREETAARAEEIRRKVDGFIGGSD